MELTPEQNATVLAKVFKKQPWEGRATYDETTGTLDFTPVETESHGAVSAGLRQFVQAVPETAASLAGGAAVGGLAKLGTTPLKALGPVGFAAGVGGDLLAQGVGAGLGSAAYQKFGPTKMMRNIAYGDAKDSEMQNLRDITEHPTAAKVGGYASMIPLARFQNPKELLGGVRKLGKIATMLPQEAAALKTAASNAAVGAGMEGYRQLKEGKFDPAALFEATAVGLPFGKSRLGPRETKSVAAPETASNSLDTTADTGPSRFDMGGNLKPLAPDIGQRITTAEPLPIKLATPAADPVEMARQKALAAGLNVDQLEQVATESAGERPFVEVFPAVVEEALRPKPQAADAPTPEPIQVLAEAFAAAADPGGTKKMAFVPTGSDVPANTEGLVPIKHAKGTLWVNMEKTTPEEARAAAQSEQVPGTMLGLSQDTKPLNPQAAVVTDRPGAPAVLTEIVDSPQAAEAAKTAQAQAMPSGTQRVTTPEEVVSTREQLVNQEGDRQATPAPPVIQSGSPPEMLVPPEQRIHVPWSVVNSVAKISKQTGAALSDMLAEKSRIVGNYAGKLMTHLQQFPKDFVNATLEKRLKAHMLGAQPNYTPEERAVVDSYAKTMTDSAREATAAGYPINAQQHYVPEMPAPQRMREYQHDPTEYIKKYLPAFHRLNSQIYGASYDPAAGADYFVRYHNAASKAPNSLGSEFAALVKSAREYHLPDEVRDMDHFSVLNRYFNRYANQIAKAKFIDSNPEARRVLGYDQVVNPQTGTSDVDPLSATTAAHHARAAVENILGNPDQRESKLYQEAKQVATGVQQAAYSGTIGPLTAAANTLQKYKDHLMHGITISGGLGEVLKGTLRPMFDWQARKAAAIEQGITRPGVDPTQISDDMAPALKSAQILKHGSIQLRKYTLGEFFETFNRVSDFTIGEGMARTQLELAKRGDVDAQNFLNKFGAGVLKSMTPEQQAGMIGKNYAEAIQSTYGPQGLAAPLLKSGLTSKLFRIQRYGIENMARTYQYAIKPAAAGDFRPLVGYMLGAALTAPMLEKVREWFTGKHEKNVPTDEEISAGKKPEWAEKILNVMAAARELSLFGAAGSALGTVAANVRGQKQGLVGDPSISLAVDLMQNLSGAAQAWREGESPIEAMLEAVKRTLTDNVQLLRRFGREPAEADDMRNKRIFEYLNERRKVPIGEMVMGATLGGLGSLNARELSPNKEAAQEGDQEALMRMDPKEQKRLKTYPGSFANPQVEGQFQGWLQKTKGPEAVEAYRGRKMEYRKRVSGR